MDFRDPNLIEEELKDTRELISLNEELLVKFSDEEDPALEFNLDYLKERENELINELNNSNEHYNMDSFIVVINEKNPPLKDVLEVSNSFQELLYPLAKAEKDPVKRNAQIPIDLKNSVTLGLNKALAGSLRLYLKTDPLKTDPQKKFVTKLQTAITNLNKLIECGKDEKLLKEQTKKLGTQSIDKYKNFLEVLSKKEFDIILFDKDPQNEKFSKNLKTQKITQEFAESTYQVITKTEKPKTEIINLEGELGLIDMFSKTFKIKDSNNKKVQVKFAEHFTEQIKRRLETTVKVEVEVTKIYHELEDKMEKEMKLIKFIN